MQIAELSAYLRTRVSPEIWTEVQAELARFRAQSGDTAGDENLDRLLAHLHERRLISTELFRELHAADPIALARLLGVRKNRTLILDQPGNTQRLPDAARAQHAAASQSSTADAPTLVPAPAPGTLTPPSHVAHSGHIIAEAEGHGDSSGYMLLGQLGKGGMGEVHVARDLELLRKVAFKRLLSEHLGNQDLAARFLSEVQITAQLDHPNILPIYELEVGADGVLGYSMKLVQGRTFSAIIEESQELARDGKPRAEARRLAKRLDSFLKVCDAMSYAHSKGVLHRDLKPSNIMLGRYREVYVMDWGTFRLMGTPAYSPHEPGASNASDEGQVITNVTVAGKPVHGNTQYGTILGTPAYMSPEQAQGRVTELDQRSDLYALGLILYELVSLRQAITGDTVEATVARAAQGDKNPLIPFHSRLRITRDMRAIIARATAPDRNQRYATVKELADDVRAYLRGDAVAALPDGPLQAAARWIGRHKVAALGVIALLVLASAAALLVLLLQ